MSTKDMYLGIEALLMVIDMATRASTLVRRARGEGRDVSSAELATLRQTGDSLMIQLDVEIAKAKAEGR